MNPVQVDPKSYQMPPQSGFTIAHFLTVADIERSAQFYERVFGGRILSRGDRSGAPGYIQIANTCGPRFFLDGVYCSPSYVCDPADGICKCGGLVCGSGNCDADSGACLPGCPADAGSGSIMFEMASTMPGEASVLPLAILEMAYSFQIVTACESGPVRFTALSALPPDLVMYPSGEIEGLPTMATNGVPFEFEVEAQTESGEEAFQNFLLEVEGNNPPP